jgi:hypothetical protein
MPSRLRRERGRVKFWVDVRTRPHASAIVLAIGLGSSVIGIAAASNGASAAPRRPVTQAWTAAQPWPSGAAHPQPVRGLRSHFGLEATAAQASSNWAGLIATGGQFTQISADWTVPAVQLSPTEQASATWVGVDGVSNSSLLQTGTFQATADDVAEYFAWYEILPAPAVLIGGVEPGDQMAAAISSTSAGIWTVRIEDFTSDQEFDSPVSYDGPGTSAEWIEEAPATSTGSTLSLANFGSVMFNNVNYAVAAEAAVTATPVFMLGSQQQVIAYPGNVNTAGHSFSVTFGAPPQSGATTTTSVVIPTTTTTPGATTTTLASSFAPTTTTVVRGSELLTRTFGGGRIDTSVAISRAMFPVGESPKVALLATARSFADAVAGTPLAVAMDGPLLITAGSSGLEPEVVSELARVLPNGATVYILGGASAVSAAIASEVQELGYVVDRVAGVDRFDTAVRVAETLPVPPKGFLEANGLDFPDAVTAGAAAANGGDAVILTDGATMPLVTAMYINTHLGIGRYAIGKLAATADPAATTTDIVGADRYATSTMVATQFFRGPVQLGFASGSSFADALCGGVGIAANDGPLLLVPGSGPLPTSVTTYLSNNVATIAAGTVYGGTEAVGPDVFAELLQAVR